MLGSAVWKWKAGDYRQETGCSICKSSPPEGFDERWHPLPLNPMECALFRSGCPIGDVRRCVRCLVCFQIVLELPQTSTDTSDFRNHPPVVNELPKAVVHA